MAATQASASFGAILKKETVPSGGTYSDWGLEITSITPPGFATEAIDATHMTSPNGWRERIANGVRDQKPIALEVNWIPSLTGTIKTALTAGKANWQILFPDNSVVTFAAILTDFSPSALVVDGKHTASLELTPSGEPTWA